MILAHLGRPYLREKNKSWFSLIHERHQRIKILNKNGLEAANFIIVQYRSNNSEEKIEKPKAATYNLVDGRIEESKLEDNAILKDIYNKNYSHTKFGLPNVKEGSIVEVV